MSKILIVTGGSRGIGAACARLAARQGWDVAVNYLARADKAAEVVRDVEAAGRRAVAVQADVGGEAGVLHLFRETDRLLGRLDGLINNAGIMLRLGPASGIDEAGLERLWAANITSAFLCAREAVQRMSTALGGRGGGIVNMSSAAARLGGATELVSYAATKGALDAMTRGLAVEVAEQGIRVNAVRPGLIETEIHASGGNPDRVAQLTPRVPMKRSGSAEEVAAATLWLLSGEASYVTGSFVEVSGGR